MSHCRRRAVSGDPSAIAVGLTSPIPTNTQQPVGGMRCGANTAGGLPRLCSIRWSINGNVHSHNLRVSSPRLWSIAAAAEALSGTGSLIQRSSCEDFPVSFQAERSHWHVGGPQRSLHTQDPLMHGSSRQIVLR